MAKEVRYFKQIVPHLEERFGKDRAQSIVEKARLRYVALLDENDDEPKAYYRHTRERIYPAIAFFDAMIDEGIERGETADFLVGYYAWRSSKLAPMIRRLLKIPGLYRLVPKIFFAMTESSFGPEAGFEAKNKHVTKTEMSFDMCACPYQDRCVRYGCPEIVRGFCDADDICYGDMHPHLEWKRTKTLGRGQEVCDFRIRVTK